MSSFVPLNLAEDPTVSKKDLEEEHTRELQIEQAFKLFQKALELHKDKKYIESFKTYEDLFKLDVISNHYYEETDYVKGLQNGTSNEILDNLNLLSPNVKLLRYLIFRNRGFLYYDILKVGEVNQLVVPKAEDDKKEADQEDEVNTKFKDIFYTMVEDFCSSLIYQEADEKLLVTIYRIFAYLKCMRLSRFVLEYTESSRIESDDYMSLFQVDSYFSNRYKQILYDIEGVNDKKIKNASLNETESIEKELGFLMPIKKEFERQIMTNSMKSLYKINLHLDKNNDISWTSVITDINSSIREKQDKERVQGYGRNKLKTVDPYSILGDPIDRVVFSVPSPVVEEDKIVQDIEEQDQNENEENEEHREALDDDAANQDKRLPVNESGKGIGQVTGSEVDVLKTAAINDCNGSKNGPVSNVKKVENPDNNSNMTETNNQNKSKNVKDSEDNLNEHGTLEEDGFEERTPEVINRDEEGADNSEKVTQEPSSPLKTQRSSKRFKSRHDISSYNSEYEVTKNDFGETIHFFDRLNHYFLKLGAEDIALRNIVSVYIPDEQDNISIPTYLHDYVRILNNFDISSSKCFLSNNNNSPTAGNNDNESEKEKLIDVLGTFGSKNNSLTSDLIDEVPPISTFETSNIIESFLSNMSSDYFNYREVKIAIISRLVGIIKDANSKVSILISETKWSSELYLKVREWIIQYEREIYSQIVLNEHYDERLQNLALSVGIFEVLVDTYISMQNNLDDLFSKVSRGAAGKKANINNIAVDLVHTNGKLTRWSSYLENKFNDMSVDLRNDDSILVKLFHRFRWSSISKEKSQTPSWSDKKSIIQDLQSLLDDFLRRSDSYVITLPNYESIGEISVESLKSQLTTTSVMSMFAKILSTESGKNTDEAIFLLESILMDGPYSKQDPSSDNNMLEELIDLAAVNSIRLFLSKSSIDMKLSLWNVLFSYYDDKGSLECLQYGFKNYMISSLRFLESVSYKELESSERSHSLLRILGFYDKSLEIFLRHLSESRWNLGSSREGKLSTITPILKYFEILYIFSIHEEASILSSLKRSIKSKSAKLYFKFKDSLIRTVTLLFIYYKDSCIGKDTEKIVADLLSLVHDQVGLRKLCDSSGGLFLRMAQDVLLNMTSICEKELLQVVSCRYHFSISSEGFTPVDHETSSSHKMDDTDANRLANFVLPLFFRKNPLIFPPRQDTKSLIDDFYDVLGDPDFENNRTINKNGSNFDSFLEQTGLSSKFIRDAFYGLVDLDFKPTECPNRDIIDNGVYYLQGLMIFASYKIRKKNMQSRAVEVENVISLLKGDLIFGSGRVESWLLLGQAFGFLVEDDLIWTSDKLNITERKVGTANLQRKALLCYFMAVNQSVKPRNSFQASYLRPLIGILMSSLGKEMYSACMQPMDMYAFMVQSNPRFIRKPSGASFVNLANHSSVSRRFCLSIMQRCLILTVKAKPKDWSGFYYLSKVQKKLDVAPEEVLNTMFKACKLAKAASNASDPIIEPHYSICSLIYKYVKSDKLSINVGMKCLADEPVISFDSTSYGREFNNKKDFYNVMVTCLRKIIAYDKKKWHHKPRYRLASILFADLGDAKEAISEMNTFVSLKATSKTLVSIWKPENERPGKHFFHTFQYIQLFISLLADEKDIASLISMLPKLRRSNATMISLYYAWEKLCSTICKMLRNSLEVDDSFTETFLLETSYQDFMQKSKGLVESSLKDEIPNVISPLVCFLQAMNDMKKFNNGFGPTSLIDDTIVSLYIKIYYHFEVNKQENAREKENYISDSPGGKMKKLAKRDVFPFTADILKNSKRQIDTILKENPQIYNEFVVHQNLLTERANESPMLAKARDCTPNEILLTPKSRSKENGSDTSIYSRDSSGSQGLKFSSLEREFAEQKIPEEQIEVINDPVGNKKDGEDIKINSIPGKVESQIINAKKHSLEENNEQVVKKRKDHSATFIDTDRTESILKSSAEGIDPVQGQHASGSDREDQEDLASPDEKILTTQGLDKEDPDKGPDITFVSAEKPQDSVDDY